MAEIVLEAMARLENYNSHNANLNLTYEFQGRPEWWGYEFRLPDCKFPTDAQKGDSFPVNVHLLEDGHLERVSLIPDAVVIKQQFSTSNKRVFPAEPDNYDDPDQLDRYDHELRKHFHCF